MLKAFMKGYRSANQQIIHNFDFLWKVVTRILQMRIKIFAIKDIVASGG